MKRCKCEVNDRWSQILQYMKGSEKDVVKVEELAQTFEVSLMTIRRDLQQLENQHLITRTFGGAVLSSLSMSQSPSEEEKNEAYRDAVSRLCAELVKDGETIFINGSMTALGLLNYLGNKRVTVITNNAAAARSYPSNIKVSLTGGELRDGIMTGDYVIRNLLSMTADKVFLGCARVYDNGEFGYNIPTEISINEMMVSRTSGKIYVVADKTKLAAPNRENSGENYGSCRYDRPCTLITNENADAAVLEKLREEGITVLEAKCASVKTADRCTPE